MKNNVVVACKYLFRKLMSNELNARVSVATMLIKALMRVA